MRWRFVLLAFGAVAAVGAMSSAAEPLPKDDAAKKADYLRDIRPIFASRCYSCHGPDAQEGGLRLSSKKTALAGGDTGKVISPGKAAESLLIRYVTGENAAGLRMPPETEGDGLSAEQISLLKNWIDQGAIWPDDPKPKSQQKPSHWSFQPIRRPPLPRVRNAGWARTPIDAFILSELERRQIAPSPEADRATLLRRVYLDLLGLPPPATEVAAFVRDSSGDAYARMVERLLASPHYGERWGRHWLDLARYADSDGYEKDSPRPNAWRFRQWVIEAFNRDLPFDQFTLEQLAGDLLPEATLDQKIATGFHRNTLTNREGGIDPEEDRVKQTIDRTNTTGTVWLGLTVECAQCHTHKYDPIAQREYYGLYAFFNSAQELDLDLPLESNSQPAVPPKNAKDRPLAPTLTELRSPRATHVLIRGDFLQPGDTVEPGTPEALPPLQNNGRRPTRLDLAQWLVDGKNPLTARVTVNRIWQRYFGRGLVETSHDFGTQGEKPSHAALLDWLASEFMSSGWSMKSLHRMIVTSATYRQSSASRPELSDRDPLNRLLARQNRLRVEAEVVRDLALASGGLIVPQIGGPSVRPPQPEGIDALGYAGAVKWPTSQGADRYRRGVYTFFQRTVPYPMFKDFDAPDGNLACTKRERSNTPIAALTLQNDPVFVECAQAFARRIVNEHPCRGKPDCTLAGRIKLAHQLTLGRNPNNDEWDKIDELHNEAIAYYSKHEKQAAAMAGPLQKPAGVTDAELAAWTLVGRTLFNLDEFITRE
jgi:mono/diheme cytochrome c family protein